MAALIWGEYVRPTIIVIVIVGYTVRGGIRPSIVAIGGTKELYTIKVVVKYYIITTGKVAKRPSDSDNRVGYNVRGRIRPSIVAIGGIKEIVVTKEIYTNKVVVKR